MKLYTVTILTRTGRSILNIIAESSGKAASIALRMTSSREVPSALICKAWGAAA